MTDHTMQNRSRYYNSSTCEHEIDYELFLFDHIKMNEESFQPKAFKDIEKDEMEVKGNSFTPRPIPCTQPELEVFGFDYEHGLMDFGPMLESFCFEIDFIDRSLEPKSLKEEVLDLNENYVGDHFDNFRKDYHNKESILFAKNLVEDVKSSDKKQLVQEDIEVP